MTAAQQTTRIRTLRCCCCGEQTRGRQWWNRDTGYGLCVSCANGYCASEIDASGYSPLYGQRGVHFDVEPHRMNIYLEHGYPNRRAYLSSLADEYGLDWETVATAAHMLGPDEDFDGLLTTLQDYFGQQAP